MFRVFAYCTAVSAKAVARATGTRPLTSPPWTNETFRPGMLEGHDLIYFRLHGFAWMNNLWLGEDAKGRLYPAIDSKIILAADLGGAVVVLANCYGAESPMVQELYQAGASAVIAGHGPNYAFSRIVGGADKLVCTIIREMAAGAEVRDALKVAKATTKTGLMGWRRANRDAAKFMLIEREK